MGQEINPDLRSAGVQIAICICATFIGGCATVPISSTPLFIEDSNLQQRIANEPEGNYFVGRRLYGGKFSFWGYVRKPRESWKQAQLVMLNEQRKHAPDRDTGRVGADNNYEYRLRGYFSGDVIYEATSGRFYPEFVLTGYKLIDRDPPPFLPANFVETMGMFRGWPIGEREPGPP